MDKRLMTVVMAAILVALVITGSVKLAAAIGGTEVVTKSLLFYLHERAWLKIPYGRNKKPASLPVTEAEPNLVKKS